MRWYQSVCQESMEGARKAIDAVNGTSEAVTGSVDRLQEPRKSKARFCVPAPL